MRSHTHISETEARSSPSAIADYIALLKPRVTALVVLTALAGLIAADTPVPLPQIVGIMCAITLGSGAAAAFNMWYDRDIDAMMLRTVTRPIPAGRVEPDDALGFSILLAAVSLALMIASAGILPTLLLAVSILFYAGVYTAYLKRRTDQNIVIGGAAGALPPVIGWSAASGDITLTPILLFAIIFIWTPPHFWALSLWTHHSYAKARIPMLPVTQGVRATRLQILLYSIILAPLGVAPAVVGTAGPVYMIVSAIAGLCFLATAVLLWASRAGEAEAPQDIKRANTVFVASILYLAVIFIALAVETTMT